MMMMMKMKMKMKTGFIIVSKEAVSMLLFASCGGRACDRLDISRWSHERPPHDAKACDHLFRYV